MTDAKSVLSQRKTGTAKAIGKFLDSGFKPKTYRKTWKKAAPKPKRLL
jgi:hypothetical protein